MAYHITSITNKSAASVAITNPAHEADSRLVVNGDTYNPERPILVNKITTSGTVNYQTAAATALNLYTASDNFCFWDNGSSAANGVGQKSSGNFSYYSGPAGNLAIVVGPDGSLSIQAA